ncbi:ubiquinol oxidase, mitochondrial [Solanum dulcamara]|uniref:ubiquinol oxidase, mitochondrial n=1 Tax=Solanum dulcamara TaxID=45834 RepID=UPI0024855DDB|nr:ubiquinol oxidase, mitochondrial [Solanum dulcamara]
MNQLLARSLMRRLISGSTCNRCISSLSSSLAVVFREVSSESVVMMSGQRLRFSGQWWRMMSSTSEQPTKNSTKSTAVRKEDEKLTGDSVEKMEGKDDVAVSSYWGVSRPQITKEDGSVWPWNCFMPWETYQADLSIDLSKHHVPKTLLDKVAYWTVKLLRIPTDIFFKRKYGCRAMMLETVAGVPGMVGGMLLHLRSLRKFEQSGGWIKALLEEAENERMHLMTMVELVQPKWYERLLVLVVQGVFFNFYFVLYLLSPKLAHRVVGYLEEEAIHSYTLYLNDIDRGEIENVPAPSIAIDYWRLPKNATLKDVITVIRADEAHHRDVNHFASDIHYQGKKLQEAAAPIGYH